MDTGQGDFLALFSQLLTGHFAAEGNTNPEAASEGKVHTHLCNRLKAETILYFQLVSL